MILDLHQNTPEWHQLRQKSIGASDAPVIMGVAPWATEYELWLDKLGLQSRQVNQGMLSGQILEEKVRLLLIKKTGYNFSPCVARSKEIPYIIASLDAYDITHKKAAEIKLHSKKDHISAQCEKVPDKYFPQLQHQMYVLDLEEIIYSGCYLENIFNQEVKDENIVYFKVKRDDKYIKQLIQKEKIFFSYMEELVPPPLTDKDYVLRNDSNWEFLAKSYLDVMARRKYYEQQEEILKRELFQAADGKNVKGCGVFVQKIVKKGTIDYKRIPTIKDVDLEMYRGSNTEYYRINVM